MAFWELGVVDCPALSAVQASASAREVQYYSQAYKLQAVRSGPWNLALGPQHFSMSMTHNDSPEVRARTAAGACAAAGTNLALFALAGTWILRWFGLSLPAIQIAGSIVLTRHKVEINGTAGYGTVRPLVWEDGGG